MKRYIPSFLLLLFCGTLAGPLHSSNGDSLLSGDPELDMSAPLPMPPGEGEQIYKPGKVFLDLGVHIGRYRYGYGNTWRSLTPMIPLSADVEVAALDFIGIGGYFGFATRKYEYQYTDWDNIQGYHTDVYEQRYTYTSFGAKGVFHVIPFLNKTFDFDHNLDGSKYDLYIAHYLGVRVESSKWASSDVDDDVRESVERDRDLRFSFMNPTIGGRYMFSNFFGVYAEVGYGHWGGSDLKGGITMRF